jgi:hypothetical protein
MRKAATRGPVERIISPQSSVDPPLSGVSIGFLFLKIWGKSEVAGGPHLHFPRHGKAAEKTMLPYYLGLKQELPLRSAFLLSIPSLIFCLIGRMWITMLRALFDWQ